MTTLYMYDWCIIFWGTMVMVNALLCFVCGIQNWLILLVSQNYFIGSEIIISLSARETFGRISHKSQGPIFCLLLRVSSDYAQLIIGQGPFSVSCSQQAQGVLWSYWSNLPCNWPSTAWAYSEQETENRPRSLWCNQNTTQLNKPMCPFIGCTVSTPAAAVNHHWSFLLLNCGEASHNPILHLIDSLWHKPWNK